MGEVLREHAPFKINLSLKVVGKRADGYHLLETLFAFADRGDELTWQPGDALTLQVVGPFAHVAPPTPDNLVMRAALSLAAAFPEQAKAGGRLTLTKNVPAGAGLGGGSADAAATLRLLNKAWGLELGLAQLSRFAAPLGADVPVCVCSAPAWARGIGDDLHHLLVVTKLPLLVIFPDVSLSTRAIFSSSKLLFSKASASWPPAFPTLAGGVAVNDLAAPAAEASPIVAKVLADLERVSVEDSDILLTGMSGSGSACFALARTGSALQHLARELQSHYPPFWLFSGKLAFPFI